MFDVMNRGVFTIIGLVIAVAVIGYILVSLDFGAGVIVGVVVALLLLLFFPTIIELFI